MRRIIKGDPRQRRKLPRRWTSGNVSLVTSARLSRTIYTNIRRSAHVSCDMNNNLSGNYIESSPWVSNTSQKPREKEWNKLVWALARLSANRAKVTQICAGLERKKIAKLLNQCWLNSPSVSIYLSFLVFLSLPIVLVFAERHPFIE